MLFFYCTIFSPKIPYVWQIFFALLFIFRFSIDEDG